MSTLLYLGDFVLILLLFYRIVVNSTGGSDSIRKLTFNTITIHRHVTKIKSIEQI